MPGEEKNFLKKKITRTRGGVSEMPKRDFVSLRGRYFLFFFHLLVPKKEKIKN